MTLGVRDFSLEMEKDAMLVMLLLFRGCLLIEALKTMVYLKFNMIPPLPWNGCV